MYLHTYTLTHTHSHCNQRFPFLCLMLSEHAFDEVMIVLSYLTPLSNCNVSVDLMIIAINYNHPLINLELLNYELIATEFVIYSDMYKLQLLLI